MGNIREIPAKSFLSWHKHPQKQGKQRKCQAGTFSLSGIKSRTDSTCKERLEEQRDEKKSSRDDNDCRTGSHIAVICNHQSRETGEHCHQDRNDMVLFHVIRDIMEGGDIGTYFKADKKEEFFLLDFISMLGRT